jgi:hypothetical protein
MATDTATTEDRVALERVALDYLEGWFDGDVTRMERALHPELCKRSLDPDAAGSESLKTFTASQMIGWTAEGLGRTRDVPDRRIEVDVEDVFDTIANVTVRSAVYREYLQLVRTDAGWKIANAMWQRV